MDIKNTILKNIANHFTHGNWQNQGDRLPLPKTSLLALCLTNGQFYGSQTLSLISFTLYITSNYSLKDILEFEQFYQGWW